MRLSEALEQFEFNSLEEVSLDVLKKKYRKLAKETHPDKGGHSAGFIKIQEAYNIILEEYEMQNDPNLRSLKELSKKEILDQYYTDKQNWEKQLSKFEEGRESTALTIQETYIQAKSLTEEYNQSTSKIQSNFEKEILKLKQKYYPSWWQYILFLGFLRNKSNFQKKFNYKTNEYQAVLDKIHKNYLVELNKIYSKSLDKMSSFINKRT